jgi:hypothetical protein
MILRFKPRGLIYVNAPQKTAPKDSHEVCDAEAMNTYSGTRQLNSETAYPNAGRQEADWVRLGPEYKDLEIRTRGASPDYEAARLAMRAAAAAKLGIVECCLPLAAQQKIEAKCLCDWLLSDVRNLTAEDGTAIPFGRFCKLLKQKGYKRLLAACIRASGGTPPEALLLVDSIHSKIAGVSFPNDDGTSRQEIIHNKVYPGVPLSLRFVDSPFDRNAVAILTAEGQQLGYVRRELASEVRKFVAHGFDVKATITEVTGGTFAKPTQGVNIVLDVLAWPTSPATPACMPSADRTPPATTVQVSPTQVTAAQVRKVETSLWQKLARWLGL